MPLQADIRVSVVEGSLLVDAIRASDLTLETIAGHGGLLKGDLSAWITGRHGNRTISLEAAQQIAAAVGFSVWIEGERGLAPRLRVARNGKKILER